jgi:hypothetical protein
LVCIGSDQLTQRRQLWKSDVLATSLDNVIAMRFVDMVSPAGLG